MNLLFRMPLLLFFALSIFAVPLTAQTLIKCCNCNNTIESKPTGFGEDHSKPRLCDQCKAKRCARIAEIRTVIDKIIPYSKEKSFSPTVEQWRKLISSHRNTLDIYLGQLERFYCDDEAVLEKIRQYRLDLQALNPGPDYEQGQLLRERRKVAELDLALAQEDTARCKTAPVKEDKMAKITCPPELKEKSESDDQVLKDYLKEKLREAGETVVEDTKLGEKLEKLSKVENYWAYWQQIMAAKCIPPNLVQAMNGYIVAKKNKEDTSDECAVLCRDMADWYVAISGLDVNRKLFYESCLNHCK